MEALPYFFLIALWAIKRKKVHLHARLMSSCVVLGCLFLCSYVLYHSSVPSTIYGDTNGDFTLSKTEAITAGLGRTFYLCLLGSHIVCSNTCCFLCTSGTVLCQD